MSAYEEGSVVFEGAVDVFVVVPGTGEVTVDGSASIKHDFKR